MKILHKDLRLRAEVKTPKRGYSPKPQKPPPQEECVICGRPHPGETLLPAAPFAAALWGPTGTFLGVSGATLSPYCLKRLLSLRALPHDTLYTRPSPRAKRGAPGERRHLTTLPNRGPTS